MITKIITKIAIKALLQKSNKMIKIFHKLKN